MRSETNKSGCEQCVKTPPHVTNIEEELVHDESSSIIYKIFLTLAIIMGVVDVGIIAVAL